MSRFYKNILCGVVLVPSLLAADQPVYADLECYPPPPDMIAWYAGDTCWSDDLLDNHDGTYLGCPLCFEEYKVGGAAMYFSPPDELCLEPTYIAVPHDLQLNPGYGEFTIDAWIFTQAQEAPIVTKYQVSGYWLYLSVGQVHFQVCDDAVTCYDVGSISSVSDGEWHHVAGTLARSGESAWLTVYVDGQAEAFSALSPLELVGSATDLRIGADGGGNGPPETTFDGLMDEIEFFSRALTADEILAIYEADAAGKCKQPCVEPPNLMRAWWTGDDCTPVDLLGNHDGSYPGGVPACGDYLVGNGALAFPGDAYVLVPHDDALDPGSGNMTIELWLRTEQNSGGIAEKYDYYGYYFAVYFNGMPGFGICEDGNEVCWIAQAYVAINDGDWHHLAGVVESEGISLYIDGAPAASTAIPGRGNVYSAVDLTLGGIPPGPYFNGAMDEITVYGRALNPGEIAAIYQAGPMGKCKDCQILAVPGDYPTIQAAIDSAKPCDEVVVSPGTYPESINLLGKAITVHSTEGADATSIQAPAPGSVVQCVSGEGADTVLAGFTIAGGSGDTSFLGYPAGGGMLNMNGSSPTVVDCVFESNAAREGAGIFNGSGSQPLISGCTFRLNEALGSPPGIFLGGAMYNAGGSAPRLENCVLELNAAGHAGGLYNAAGSNPTVIGSAFIENDGGGMYNGTDSTPTVIGCDFVANTSTSGGGGMLNWWGADAMVVDCTFTENTSYNHGGGMDNHSNATVVLNSRFFGNFAPMGGGLNNDDSTPALFNCIFTGNIGGGIRNNSASSLSIGNCSLFGNLGGGILGGEVTVLNSILWDNGAEQVVGVEPTSTVSYSVVEGGWSGNGAHNMDQEPLCVNPDGVDDTYGTADDNLRLRWDSPCIDAGDNVAFLSLALARGGLMPPGDLDGRARFLNVVATPDTGNGLGAIIDVGAYEFQVVAPADLNRDGVIDAVDLALLLGSWGPY